MLNLALKAEEGHLAELITTFKNLGDTTRYKVLKNISNGITSTKDIANSLGVSSATVSYHINQLNTSKILKLERVNGKYINSVNIEWINNCISKLKKDLKL
jgi:predicted transcriptional regulator